MGSMLQDIINLFSRESVIPFIVYAILQFSGACSVIEELPVSPLIKYRFPAANPGSVNLPFFNGRFKMELKNWRAVKSDLVGRVVFLPFLILNSGELFIVNWYKTVLESLFNLKLSYSTARMNLSDSIRISSDKMISGT